MASEGQCNGRALTQSRQRQYDKDTCHKSVEGGCARTGTARTVDDIIENRAASWKQYGPNVLDYLAKTDQVAYAKLAVSILPRDVLVQVDQRIPGGLDPQDWALMLRVLDLVKQNVPLEANAGPQEVFSVIEDALRIHFAKKQSELIEG